MLAKHGVVFDGTDTATTPEDIAQCAALLETSGFWSKRYTLHPNQGRVKNWLWVHQKYRDQSQALLEMVPEERPVLADIVKLTAAFEKLEGKIKSHSAFEDEQLFSFFEQHVRTSAASMKVLMDDHQTTTDSSKVEEALKEGNTKGNIYDALEAYHNRLLAHLAREEDAVLPVWLGLSEEQYQELRNGMSWKYRVMYG